MKFPGIDQAARGLLTTTALAAAAFAAAPLAAQDAGTEPAAASDDQGIVVTALRRSETLQDTPVAVTAFDTKAIENGARS